MWVLENQTRFSFLDSKHLPTELSLSTPCIVSLSAVLSDLMESFLNKEKKEQRKSKEGEKKKKERSITPALLLLTEAESFCLNCINYSVIFRLKIHQNSPYLASLHERSLKCQFQLPCLCSFAICVLAMLANLQSPIAISGFHDWNVPLLLQTRVCFPKCCSSAQFTTPLLLFGCLYKQHAFCVATCGFAKHN